MRWHVWPAIAALAILQSGSPAADDAPRAAVRDALHAVQGDSAPIVAQRWRAQLAKNPSDRVARLGLASLARLTYDYPDAERQYAELIPTKSILSYAKLDRVAVYALLGLAWQADTRGLPVQADSLFGAARAAARATGDPVAESEALLGWALQRAPVVGVEAGFAMLDSAKALIPPNTPDLESAYRTRRALLLAVMSQPGAAQLALEARALAHGIGEPRLEAQALRVLALDLKLRGAEDSAATVLDTVAALQRRARDHSGLAETLLRQHDALYARGDLGRLRQLSLEAATEARYSHNRIAYRSILVGLGSLSILLHDYASADVYLTRAIDRCRVDGDSAVLMLARGHRVDLYLAMGATDRARNEALAVRAYHHRAGDASAEFAALRDLIEIDLRAGDVSAADKWLRDAEQLTKREPRWSARLDESRGAIAVARGEWSAANRFYGRALAALDSTQRLARYTLRARIAEGYARMRDFGRAKQELETADRELDQWRATLRDHQLRTMAFQASARSQNNRNASVAVTISALALNGDADAAAQLAEHRRARELTDRIVRARTLTDTSGQQTSRVVLAAKADLTDWSAIIPDRNTAVLEYVTGAFGAPTTLLVITRDAAGRPVVRGRALPSADSLAPRIARLGALLESNADATAPARELGAILIDPALALFAESGDSVTRIVVVPDGPLHNVPFDALRLANNQYAVQRFAIALAPSGRVLSALRTRKLTPSGDSAIRLLAFGNPSLSSTTPAAGATKADSTPRADVDRGDEDLSAFRPMTATLAQLPPLSGAEREVRLIKTYAGTADVFTGTHASVATLERSALRTYRMLHFATHAVVDERSDARTGLALASADGRSGVLSPGDVAALPLAADIVVLSACRTAGGVVIDGEGVQGLTSAFLAAGARSVVASQWRVGDDATVQLMRAMYDALAQGMSVGDALRAAKLSAIADGASPREWAAFTVVGDPLVRVPLREPSPVTLALASWMSGFNITAGVLLAAALGAAAWFAGRRRRVK